MRYLIDGYNLLHAVGLLAGPVGRHGLERARLALLERLHFSYREEAAQITVIFDARGAPPGVVPEEVMHGIRVRYTLDREADDLIEELIRVESAPGQLTVVSDDRRLRDAGRRRGCPVQHCLEYIDDADRQRVRRPSPKERPDKPEGLSAAESEAWLKEFGDLAADPLLREALGPDFEDDDPKAGR